MLHSTQHGRIINSEKTHIAVLLNERNKERVYLNEEKERKKCNSSCWYIMYHFNLSRIIFSTNVQPLLCMSYFNSYSFICFKNIPSFPEFHFNFLKRNIRNAIKNGERKICLYFLHSFSSSFQASCHRRAEKRTNFNYFFCSWMNI